MERTELVYLLHNNFETVKKALIAAIPQMAMLNQKQWKRLQSMSEKRYPMIVDNPNSNSFVFIDFGLGNFANNEGCVRFISAFNFELEKAISMSDKTPFKNKIRDILQDLFITGDDDPMSGNSDFKNRLNELLVFNWLNNCEKIDIESIEFPLKNKKSIDFVVNHKKKATKIGFEVMTVQNINPQKLDDDNSLSEHLDKYIQNKYEDKTKELQEIEKLDELYIMPIIECAKGLEKYHVESKLPYAFPAMTSDLFWNLQSKRWSMELREVNNYLELIRNGEIVK